VSIRVLAVAAVGVVLAAAVAVALASGGGDEPSVDQKRACVYSDHRVGQLAEFERLAGRDIDCAVVFNDASPDWRAWERPWFLTHRDPNLNWRRWKEAGDDRSLVITQSLFPAAVNGTDWLTAGSRGDFEGHAKALARNLVKAGLGDATIRLGHEANGTTYPYSLGDSPDERRRWREFWRRTVLAMRSVDGADFKFDWCVLAAYRPIPLREWYPGDDVVDIVGIDAYDSGIEQQGPGRWRTIYTRPLGVRDVVRFARAHGKPLSIPEWGVGPVGNQLAGGDNAAYVRGIGRVVKDNPTSYQAYFYARQWRDQLRRGPASRAAYRKSFGEH
jgi:hypothetical protein